MKTTIKSVPYAQMRYPSLGDYYNTPEGLEIVTVALPDWRHEFLIALHEFIEEAVTRHRGIAEPTIKDFDEAHLDADDPGMLPEAPYHREHILATAVEMLLAQELDVDWTAYEASCMEAEEG
jgi:hypothetical protein